jgi:photosystem II stability/assembly factor-like uncharacterized protein
MKLRIFMLVGTLVVALATVAAVHALTARSVHAANLKAVAGEPTGEPTTGGREDETSARDDWFFEQRAYPAAHTPPGALERAVGQADALDRTNRLSPLQTAPTSPLAWTKSGPQPIATIGPDASFNSGTYAGSLPVAGRVTTIAPDPGNANIAYIGAANGGVWKTTDGGANWAPKFDFQPSLSMGAIAVDPSNTQNVWAGTGEPNSAGDSYYGAGIYKSTNGGTSWTRQGPANFLQGCFVFDVAIVSSSTVLAAAAEFPGPANPTCTSSQRGLWRTVNGGTSWTHVSFPGSTLQAPTDLAQPTSPKTTVYAALYNEGVWRSTDGGATWKQILFQSGNGSPPPGQIPNYSLRGAVAVAPNAANVLYVGFVANQGFGQLAGVWKSANANAATPVFTKPVPLALSDNPCTYPAGSSGQCTYDFDLAVDPANSTIFYLGGIRLYKYTGSGSTATPIAYGSCATCIHVDQHAAVFGPGPKLWVGSDGGVYSGVSPYTGFTNRNGTGSNALAITQFNGWTSGSLQSTFLGGTQDNGTAKFTTSTGLKWNMTHGGDGGASAFQTASIFYASYFGSNVYRTTNGGSNYTDISPAGWAADPAQFYPPMEMSPSTATTLFRGTDRIWKGTTVSTTPSWTAISPHFTSVTAIGLAKSNANVIYAGFREPRDSNGNKLGPTSIRYTTNGGTNWTAVPAAQIPDRFVSDISVSPKDVKLAFASFSGFNATTPTKPGHIFKTANGGTTWSNISGNLPDVPVDSIYVDYTKSPVVIYAGTDIGVFWSADAGATWGRGGNGTGGLPFTPVMDVRLDGANLIAATHGRGLFYVAAPSGMAITSFTPIQGRTGTDVVITGPNLKYAKTSFFNGKASPTAPVYNSSTKKLSVRVPNGATGGKITIKTSEGISAVSSTSFVPTMSITGFSPTHGAAGTSVTINGIGLSGVTAVKFNGVAASIHSAGTGASVTATVPAGATTGLVTVSNASGTVTSPTSFAIP